MDISIAKEKAAAGKEVRVAILPKDVKRIVAAGHKVFVQKDAGMGIFHSDEEYQAAGAIILEDENEVYKKEIVVKLKPPLPDDFLKLKNNILISMFHYQQSPVNRLLAKEQNIKVIPLEVVENDQGERLITCSHLGGEQGMIMALHLSMKAPSDCKILILGYGGIASGAIKVSYALGAKVKILRKAEYPRIDYFLKDVDILVNAVSWPKELRDKKQHLVSKEMLKLMSPGAVILDLSVDSPGPIESCRVTNLDHPFYEEEGVKHLCIYGVPGLAPISSSIIYSEQLTQLVLDVANNGIQKLPPYLKKVLIG